MQTEAQGGTDQKSAGVSRNTLLPLALQARSTWPLEAALAVGAVGKGKEQSSFHLLFRSCIFFFFPALSVYFFLLVKRGNMYSEIPRAGKVLVASLWLSWRADCSFSLTSHGYHLSILEPYRNWKPLLEAGIAAQEGKSLWDNTGFVKKERLSRIWQNGGRQRSRAMGLEVLLLPSFNIRGKCLDWGLIIVAGLFCSKFVITRPVCICGFMSCAAFWLNIYSFLTMKVSFSVQHALQELKHIALISPSILKHCGIVELL